MTARTRLIVNLTARASRQNVREVSPRWVEEEVAAPYLSDLAGEWLNGEECWTGRQIARLVNDVNADLRNR